jgi:hypothetical protein
MVNPADSIDLFDLFNRVHLFDRVAEDNPLILQLFFDYSSCSSGAPVVYSGCDT